jgi:hypothetical protein
MGNSVPAEAGVVVVEVEVADDRLAAVATDGQAVADEGE